MFGIDTQDLQDLKIVDVKVGTGAEARRHRCETFNIDVFQRKAGLLLHFV